MDHEPYTSEGGSLRCKACWGFWPCKAVRHAEEMATLRQQLAEARAREGALREALIEVQKHVPTDRDYAQLAPIAFASRLALIGIACHNALAAPSDHAPAEWGIPDKPQRPEHWPTAEEMQAAFDAAPDLRQEMEELRRRLPYPGPRELGLRLTGNSSDPAPADAREEEP